VADASWHPICFVLTQSHTTAAARSISSLYRPLQPLQDSGIMGPHDPGIRLYKLFQESTPASQQSRSRGMGPTIAGPPPWRIGLSLLIQRRDTCTAGFSAINLTTQSLCPSTLHTSPGTALRGKPRLRACEHSWKSTVLNFIRTARQCRPAPASLHALSMGIKT
jgi:hypothetical protein